MDSGIALQRNQSLIPEEDLKKMGKDLVRLCDGIERHGLVDYEYGVWEESIVESTSLLPPMAQIPGSGQTPRRHY